MGIADLTKFIRDNFPQTITPTHISHYRFKKVAIDTSIFMYQFKRGSGGENWLQSFFNMITALRKNDVHTIFVFDGTAPPEKREEQESRREQTRRTEDKIKRLEIELDIYDKTGEVGEEMMKLNEKKPPPLQDFLIETDYIDIQHIKKQFEMKKRQIVKITPADFVLVRGLLNAMSVPYINAEKEAENLCAWLNISGKIDAVLTTDTDVLAYRAPVFLTGYDDRKQTVEEIRYHTLIKAMNFTDSEFTDFCIMCSCDYNHRIPGIGTAKSFKYLSECKTIEDLPEDLDPAPLNYRRCRELFVDYDHSCDKLEIPYCQVPNYDVLQAWCREHRVKVDIGNLQEVYRPKLVWGEPPEAPCGSAEEGDNEDEGDDNEDEGDEKRLKMI